jgi:tetratricopeptide (TPR) repeat protein/transcriptional regulator with XRE-family HTH domain
VTEGFARQLRAVKDASGRSLRDLERMLHVSNSSLSRYLSGQSLPPWPVVVALCRVAGRDPRPLRPLWEDTKRGSLHSSGPAAPARNDLPLDAQGFSGRRDEVAAVLAMTSTARLVAIDGMAGVGKTALAVHLAHRLTSLYPDGQLFLDLHGFTPGHDPVPPGEALRMLLAALGVAATRVPDGTEERAALWRSELAFRRAIAVLDNAADAAQVLPLLPGAGPSLVIITSRRRMVALADAHAISLDVLPPGDAAELFAAAVGDARADKSPVTAEVLRQCGHLPLALRVAAARMRHRPAWTASTLVDRLRDGDFGTEAVFAMSTRQLDPAQRRMFRLIGLVPTADVDAHAASALSGMPFDNARAVLDDLVDAHLLQEAVPHRYRQHDLIRGYARSLASTEDSADNLRQAIRRLFDFYLATATAAIAITYPELSRLRVRRPAPDCSAVRFESHDQAITWLDTERANLLSVAESAADHGEPAHAAALSSVLYPYLDAHALHAEALVLSTEALRATRALADTAGEAEALLDCVTMNWRQGRHGEAEDRCRRALAIERASGNEYGEARALNGLANVCYARREYDAALEYFTSALTRFQRVHDRLYEAVVLGNLGVLYASLGRLDLAESQHRRALAIHRETGSRGGQATALTNLGHVHVLQGKYEEARSCYHQALDTNRELGYASGEADDLNGLGQLARLTGDSARAIHDHTEALAIAQDVGNQHEWARALEGLARAHWELGHTALAHEHAVNAHERYVLMGSPEADDLAELLALH